jgi:hypothetical protein
MEALTADVNWVAVIVGTLVSFALGWLWYSKTLFATKWAAGVGVNIEDGSGPMLKPMIAQLVSTFLLAWVIGVTAATDSLYLAVLIALTIAGIVKANGLFTQKSTYAIVVEAGYIFAMVAVMIATHALI